MKDIESFTIDHTTLEPGVYERYTKGDVKTWDIRFVKPNSGTWIKPEASPTLEHFLATYLKNALPDNVYGVFPMGCLTGFYVLTEKWISSRTLIIALLGAHSYIKEATEIPGASEVSCGNYMFQDLEGAKEVMDNFYDQVLCSCERTILEEILHDTKNIEEVE